MTGGVWLRTSKEVCLRHSSVGMRHVFVLASVVGIAGCPSLASTLPTGCTSAVSYTIGDTVRASLGGANSCTEQDGTYEDFYNVTVDTPQASLRIKLGSAPLTTYLRVFDANRTSVANSAFIDTPDTTATVRIVLAPGNYQFVVRATVPSATGPYILSAVVDTTPVSACATPVWLTVGVTTKQTLTTAECTQGSGGSVRYYHPFHIVLIFGTAVTVTESSTVFQPAASMVGTLSGAQYSTLDTSGTVATILGFAQNTDAYQIWASSVTALQTGAYKLRVK